MVMIPSDEIAKPSHALPFWLSLGLVPLAVTVAMVGDWAVLLMPASTWWLFTVLDRITGKSEENPE